MAHDKLNIEITCDNEFIEKVIVEIEKEVFRCLYYAPSSPVTPEKAQEIIDWYGKLKKDL